MGRFNDEHGRAGGRTLIPPEDTPAIWSWQASLAHLMVVHTRKAATDILNGRSIDRLYNSFIRSVPTLTTRARTVGISSPFVPHVPMGNQIKRERERERESAATGPSRMWERTRRRGREGYGRAGDRGRQSGNRVARPG